MAAHVMFHMDVAARASELAIEQRDRFVGYLKNHPEGGQEFWKQPFEVGISCEITNLLVAWALLEELITEDQISQV